MTTSDDAMENDVDLALRAREEHVREVYQECWDEFYEWEPQYCREELRKLRSDSGALANDSWSIWGDIEEWEDDLGTATIESIDTVQIYAGERLDPSEVLVKTMKLEIDFPPVPLYEFCMPIRTCVSRIDAYEEELEEEEKGRDGQPARRRVLWIKFCPFTDPDEPFLASEKNHLLAETRLEWEIQRDVDNDVDMIEMETVSRLKDLNFEEIDEVELLPRPVRSIEDELGIVRRWHSREVVMPLHWTGPKDAPPYTVETEQGELNHSFCPICVEFECIQHTRFHQLDEAMTPKGMAEVDRQCGNDCIFNHQDNEEFSPPQDVVDLLQDLWFNYNALEWTQSCEIAKILAHPCWQVHKAMLLMLQNQRDGENGDDRAKRKRILDKPPEANLVIVPDFENYEPRSCAHPGPCLHCPCALAGSWCGAACGCSKLCARRPRGCSCRDACDTQRCRCRQELRECEPGICGQCWADEGAERCTNNFVQRRESRKTEVRRSQIGWGLFALEEISKGDSIITYTGEIYTTDTAPAREIVAEHLGRNYVFGCGKKIDIDSYAAGNESRVINQSPQGENNCIARKVWVAGDVHLIILAERTIRRGEELFFFYGPDFWAVGSNKLLKKSREKKKKRRKPVASLHDGYDP